MPLSNIKTTETQTLRERKCLRCQLSLQNTAVGTNSIDIDGILNDGGKSMCLFDMQREAGRGLEGEVKSQG